MPAGLAAVWSSAAATLRSGAMPYRVATMSAPLFFVHGEAARERGYGSSKWCSRALRHPVSAPCRHRALQARGVHVHHRGVRILNPADGGVPCAAVNAVSQVSIINTATNTATRITFMPTINITITNTTRTTTTTITTELNCGFWGTNGLCVGTAYPTDVRDLATTTTITTHQTKQPYMTSKSVPS